ncbi:MAG: DUF5131 family protein [Chromatiales bacterium]
MAQLSSIEWTGATWNALTGCTKVSPGCKNCYAERMSRRLQAMGQPNYINGFALMLHEHMLDIPLRWRKPQRVFVNSMSDLFQGRSPHQFHPESLRSDAAGFATSVSNPDETFGKASHFEQSAPMAIKHLDGSKR